MSMSKPASITADYWRTWRPNGEVLSQRYNDSRVIVHCRLSQHHLGRLNDDRAVIRPHVNGNGKVNSLVNGR